MRISQPFLQLPLLFDSTRLAAEIADIPESDWRRHPQGHPGNSALPLVAVDGNPDDDGVAGPMRPTPLLQRLPYVHQVMACLDAVIGRTRLMRIEGGGEATSHSDLHYYWQDHLRVHVPIVTTPHVRFVCGDAETHMAAGECWVFDTSRRHNVLNPDPTQRVHLVVDTVGSASFVRLLAEARPHDGQMASWAPRFVTPTSGELADLRLERENAPRVMSPWELASRVESIIAQVEAADAGAATAMRRSLLEPLSEWRALWACHGDADTGREGFAAVHEQMTAIVRKWQTSVMVEGVEPARWIDHIALRPALGERRPTATASAVKPAGTTPAPRADGSSTRIEQPIFIISPPRSGSSLLFETLARAPALFTIGRESHAVIESIKSLSASARDYESNALDAEDARPEVVAALQQHFLSELRDRDGKAASGPVRMLEKTPKNALRVRFLAAAFPDARFVYLYRDPRETIASMLDAWRSGHFRTYPDLPGWEGPDWSLVLTRGWRNLIGRGLPEVVARQWASCVQQALDDLQSLPAGSWCVADYGRLVSEPELEIRRLCEFLSLDWDQPISAPLPQSRTTLTSPHPDKWRGQEKTLKSVLPYFEEAAQRARDVFASPPQTQPPQRRPPTQTVPPESPPVAKPTRDFSSVHSTSFTALLDKLGISLAVSTYQSGRLILVRSDQGELNTHLRHLPSPMGIALGRTRLAVGTLQGVQYYLNQPEVARKLSPSGQHDACYLPSGNHVTGDIRVHDLAFDADDQLWVVNTRFSCLCTVTGIHSFAPRWRPRFVDGLAAEDRCHLNGLAMADGRPRFVTALGTSNKASGWRERKLDGGVLIDIDSHELVSHGLCMPHSPRIHDGQLWLLSSGRGELNRVDTQTGQVETVATLPGFTRGLAFAGPFAFVGLSQVREKLFDGLPLSRDKGMRKCGVWVVDTRNGHSVGILQFSGDVQEIFDVQVLPHRFPEIAEVGSDICNSAFALSDEALANTAPNVATTASA